ncbi:phosphatidylserine lipase ABHD16A-like [Liolophura sinensis]|uniref:phosphatidylserine lipase ABHD16A-like n=1 Tax=Liolophura sinensis TaxID=3198878 RepID=UPI00315954F3
MASTLINCLKGPRLFRIHRSDNNNGRLYQPNFVEATGDSFIKVIRFCWSLSFWTSPVLLTVLYRRNYFSLEGAGSLSKTIFSVVVIYTGAYIIRGIGRITNPDYVMFISVLSAAQKNFNEQTKKNLLRYDSEFWAWPVDFMWNEGGRGDASKIRVDSPYRNRPRSVASHVKAIPCHVLSFLLAHTFGRRMVYPGTTALINMLVGPTLIQQRAKLIEEKRGHRAKLQTADGNQIDTMFIDKRGSLLFPQGQTLVVCSEGNSGFYEIGCTVTPIEAGYSVLGWNHPGFAGSSGVPFPENEQNAIDAVMQYAIHRLGFTPDNIVLFAWSIGGYPASWAAMNYPDVKGVVLDATFDTLLPLAVARMPELLKDLVTTTIKKYMDLQNAEQLCRYPGPVLLIRRSRDEMITTLDPSLIHTNRGNDLLVKLLQYRYPRLVDEETLPLLRDWLSKDSVGQAQLYTSVGVDDDLCLTKLLSLSREHPQSFPFLEGGDITEETKRQLVLYLASRHMVDYDSTHCSPLPASFFVMPWSLQSASSLQ